MYERQEERLSLLPLIGGRFGGWFEAFLARKVGWSVKGVQAFSPAIYLPKRTLLFSSFEKEKSAFQKASFLKRWKNIWTFEGLFVILQREYKGNRE